MFPLGFRTVICVFCCTFLFPLPLLAAGFLEMPDTTEVPEYERESMLLDLDVPGVRDRDPDPEGGPRLNVKEFRLQGVVEYPELGITRAALIKQVEDIRFDIMKEGELLESGYTEGEISEVSDLLAEIEDETKETHVSSLEVQRLIFLIREQRRKRGVTLGMIETVADTITLFYRQRGFILAKAYIPKQQVRDGVVTLTLLLGELGGVELDNGRRVSNKLVQRVFKGSLHKPVTAKKTEEALFLVNDIPGVSAQGFFRPGKQVGDTILGVNIAKEKWYSTNMRVDNHGSARTGEFRLFGDVRIHNPLGIGDEILFSALYATEPGATTYGGFRYSTFLYSPSWRLSTGISTNGFDAPNANNSSTSLSFSGKTTVKDIVFSRILNRSRVKNISLDFGFSKIDTSLFIADRSFSDEFVTNSYIGLNFDILNERKNTLHFGNVTIKATDGAAKKGTDNNSAIPEKENAQFLTFDYTRLAFWKVPLIKADTRVLTYLSGQYSGRELNTVDRISLSGPQRLKAFDVNTSQFDDAMYLGFEWLFKGPSFGEAKLFGEAYSKVFQPYVFLDMAYGEIHTEGVSRSTNKGELSDIGFGVKISHRSLSGNVTFASAIQQDTGIENEELAGDKVYVEFQYRF